MGERNAFLLDLSPKSSSIYFVFNASYHLMNLVKIKGPRRVGQNVLNYYLQPHHRRFRMPLIISTRLSELGSIIMIIHVPLSHKHAAALNQGQS